MICGQCGTANEVGRKFCGECGTRLALVCPSCGTTNAPASKFCGECATPLVDGAVAATSAPAPPRIPATPATGAQSLASPARLAGALGAHQPVAELRLVSVLFADLVGFTSLAEGRDAEDTRELLSRYFDLAREVIERYGGNVEKFIGDAVMAVWGAPLAHEDDAERAVRAALELVAAVRSLGPGIAARAGVLTGEAAVTIGAKGQGMVAGDIVNTASRLQAVAAPGTVLVGDATERAASRAIAFEPAGEQALKGKSSPVPSFRALRVIAQVGGRGRSETLEAPFVGREDELRLVKDLFHATVRERRARLVSVIGAAGIGKTRLAWEFSKYRDGLVEGIWFHEGRSPAYGDSISFWALGEMIRRRAGLLETDDAETTRAAIATAVEKHVPDPAERRWIESALLVLLGIDAEAAPTEELFAAWRAFFERLASTDPVVLVFEDFHYADDGLIDFVDHLLEWSRTFPIYIVTLARPDLLERRPDWGAGKRSFTSIFLEALPREAMHELLSGLVPGLPDAASSAIVDRADGVPLYAVETVRMLLSEGRLTMSGGTYRPTGDLTSLAVPETLTALIASRLDALPPVERALASDAAVLGQSFTPAGLASVSGLAEEELATALRSLTSREILHLQTDPRSPERGQYVFVQALIREVAYNALAKRDRKVRHLAAARFFESLGTDEVAGGLAGHYLAAYRNSTEGAEADAVAAQARIALTSAANRAAGLGSSAQAVTFFEQALSVTTDPAEQARLHELAGRTATTGGRYEIAETHLREAVRLRRELGDRAGAAGACEGVARALLGAYRSPDAKAFLAPLVEEFADLASEPSVIAMTGQYARACFLDNDPLRAIEIADRVLEAAERANLPLILADTLVTKGTALGEIGRPVEGVGTIVAGRDLAEANGQGYTVLRAMNNLAFIEAVRVPRNALETSRAGLTLARRLGDRNFVASMLQNIGEFSLRTGDWDVALADLDAALGEDWDPVDRAWLLVAATPMWAARGEDVRGQVAEIRTTVADRDDAQTMANLAAVEAMAAYARWDLEAARDAWRRAGAMSAGAMPGVAALAARAQLHGGDVEGARVTLAEISASGFHGPAIDAGRETVRAGIAASEGRAGDAVALYREAMRAWRELGLPWDEAMAGLDMVLLLGPGDPEVGQVADWTRRTLAQLGAVPFVERLDAAMAASPPADVRHASEGLLPDAAAF